MPQPFNYSLGLPDPSRNFLQGLQVLSQIEEQKKAQAQVDQRNSILTNLMALENPTADDYVKASLALPEDRELFKQAWDMHDQGKRDALFKGGAEAYMLADRDPTAAKAKLEEWALGFENSGDDEAAKQFRTAAKLVETDPKAAKTTIGMMLSFADGERFKNVTQPNDATTFQKDFQFIKDTFGDDAAAEYAQYGRDSVVSIPIGNGQTYVGPASMAPGSSKWQAKQGGEATRSSADILQEAQTSKQITQAESAVIKQTLGLGPNGAKQYEAWLKDNGIREIVRTGTDANGRKVVQYADGTVDYAD